MESGWWIVSEPNVKKSEHLNHLFGLVLKVFVSETETGTVFISVLIVSFCVSGCSQPVLARHGSAHSLILNS